MSHNSYLKTSATIFLVVGLIHLLRVLGGWKLVLGTLIVPAWFSWLAVIFLAYMSYQGFKKR
jgi:hypothetical protein